MQQTSATTDGNPLRWIRIAKAAQKLGVPSAEVLQRDIECGRVPVRWARFGARRMMHVCASDIDAYGQLLAFGVAQTATPRPPTGGATT